MNASRWGGTTDENELVVRRVRSAAADHLGVDLRDVQVSAGMQLLRRCIVEMQTGEGKTLTTVIPAAVMARQSRHRDESNQNGGNVMIATANDYLASRDAGWMGPIYSDLGLAVGCVTSDSTPEDRQRAYACDVTYGTLREFAFDFLRWSLAQRRQSADHPQSPYRFHVLIVDEADSLLIDEARTPMIITAPIRAIDRAHEACYRWSAIQAGAYRVQDDYVRMTDSGAIALTDQGRRRVIGAAMPGRMASLTTTDILHSLERAIWVNESIHRDQHYVVKAGQIHLIDEYTGRKAAKRNFSGGIHQAIQAREGLDLTPESEPVARISVQDFVGKYKHLCGLTATAWEDRSELRTVYGLSVQRVATHQPSRRTILEPIVCRSREEKWRRIVEETREVLTAGRSVLVGTRTIEQSERLSELFRGSEIDHVVLNARNPKQEASIIAVAGRPGQVTIATNMAGRGTDIRLEPSVAAAGGLHVIVSEPHAAGRIDRQLIGRAARQGDAGTARVYACGEDEILEQGFGHERASQIRRTIAGGVSDRWLLAKLKRAQQQVSRNHRKERGRLTAHEASLADSMQRLGLDPHLDPLPEPR